MDVLKRLPLRRHSKDAGLPVRPGNRHDRTITVPSALLAQDPSRLTFFDLPAEIRNTIYDELASTTVLTLTPQKKSTRERPPVNGLLLASRQCRKEFLPLLFSTARVEVHVRDFDFRHLMRVVSSLYSTELKALRLNHQLWIRLSTHNCTRENMASLRRWLVRRSGAMDKLPWIYDVQLMPCINTQGWIRQLRELQYYMRALMTLHVQLDESLQWEWRAIADAFDKKAQGLEKELNWTGIARVAPTVSNARGLSGGGLR